jgi:hypothetical protein
MSYVYLEGFRSSICVGFFSYLPRMLHSFLCLILQFDYLNILYGGAANIKFLKLTLRFVNIYVRNFKIDYIVYSTDDDREVSSFQC